VKKLLKYFTIIISSILVLMLALPYIFQEKIAATVKESANEMIEGDLDYKNLNLSFFKHFPNLTVSANDVFLSGTEKFKSKPLLQVKEISLGVNLMSLFGSQIIVQKIFIIDGLIHVQVDKNGQANYNIYVSNSVDTSSEAVDIKIAQINLNKIHLIYDDQSIPLLIDADDFNYSGKGDLTSEVFDLNSKITIKEMDLDFDGDQYFIDKKVDADLLTAIDTKSLKFEFKRNDLKINQLPIRFKGLISILKSGYDIDFIIGTRDAKLKELLSLLPKRFLPWLDNTKVAGNVGMFASLKGRYQVESQTFPNAEFGFKIQKGKLQYKASNSAVEDLELRFSAKMPSLNYDSLHAKLDTLSFHIDKDQFHAEADIKGYDKPNIFGKVNADLDLAKTQKALGIKTVDLKGKLSLNLLVKGIYATNGGTDLLKSIQQIPNFDLKAKIQDGYFKYSDLPLPIENIQLELISSTKIGTLKGISIDIPKINATARANQLHGKIKVSNAIEPDVDIDFNANLVLESLKDMIPLDSFDFKGTLNTALKMKGIYSTEQKLFPLSNISIVLKNGSILTPYYPQPIKDISVKSHLTATSTSYKDVKVEIEPISFDFEGQKFQLQADLQNLDDIKYDIKTNGVIELGKIYQLFALKGVDINGKIITDLSLKGLQSDAMNGRYQNLDNKGTVQLEKIAIKLEEYPQAFNIEKGVLRVNQDQINLEGITAKYMESDLTLNGQFSNVTGYILDKAQPLKGQLKINSNLLKVVDFLSYTTDENLNIEQNQSTPGVLLIPENLNIQILPQILKTDYMGSVINNLVADIKIQQGKAQLKNTSFDIAGAKANLNASYAPTSTSSADFDISITAKDFDIQKVYNEVPIFKELVSMAQYAKGIASLDYQLKGILNDSMSPLYPSLKGGGEIRIKNAQLMNFKLMNAVSKATQRDSLTNPKVKDVVIKTKISNNIITLEKTKLKIFGFRPKFEGQVSFDGDLNLKARLGLPPFGIFGIPFHISGNSENPIIKLKRAKNVNTGLEEIVYEKDDENDEEIPTDSLNISKDSLPIDLKPIK
jgi:AsmA protein